MVLTCDKCRKSFNLTNKSIKDSYLGAMYTEKYFNCSHCGEKYIVQIDNKRTRDLKRMIDIATKLGSRNIKEIRAEHEVVMRKIMGK